MREVRFTVRGEAASKANSRKLVRYGGFSRLIKSDKAIGYAQMFAEQCPCLDEWLEGDLEVVARVYYASRRPDLDESLILDGMQERIYKNDRQVKRRLIEWGLDSENPRAEILVREMRERSILERLIAKLLGSQLAPDMQRPKQKRAARA